jgi:hypothetical protein
LAGISFTSALAAARSWSKSIVDVTSAACTVHLLSQDLEGQQVGPRREAEVIGSPQVSGRVVATSVPGRSPGDLDAVADRGITVISRFESSFGVRGLRVLQGEGMVAAARTVTVTDADGSTETLVPSRTRFAPEHELIQARPELCRLCCRDDRTDTPEVFCQALRGADRNASRQLASEPTSRPPTPAGERTWQLSGSASSGSEPWRL